MSETTVVLVHGAWHGAWCWEPVTDLLAKRGVTAVAVDLPGHGADRGPLTDLHGDADRVRAVLDEADGPVVLVGHSYGGAVITEAGDHEAVSHLVFLCAMALDETETLATAVAEEAAAATISHQGRPDLGAALRPGPGETLTLDPVLGAACLYNGCSPELTEWAVARLGPQPVATIRQSPRAVAWRTKPSTYVVCTEDLTIHPAVQRLLAKRCTTTLEWPTGHSPFLSDPSRVAALLTSLARP